MLGNGRGQDYYYNKWNTIWELNDRSFLKKYCSLPDSVVVESGTCAGKMQPGPKWLRTPENNNE